ncbi:MAG TPA: TIGR03620 family F420-dependent LLM class oxidoreductase [Acidimicrobiales bacterium]|nr:TIGR03620 family F420-dependent LLM class oxidoreductase [Acidimicrobiales bacterium]
MDVGSVGLWTFQLDLRRAQEAREIAAQVDDQGWGTLWIPEAIGREAMSHAGLLLDATNRLVVATGVANVWSRAATAAAAAQRLLADDSGGRFLLGLGVSHEPMVEGMLHQSYEKPLAKMASYLDEIDDAFSTAPAPPEDPPRVLAALGPRMLRLAAKRAWGALTYFVPVDHTPVARDVLGEGPMLMVSQAAVVTTDPSVARETGRRWMQIYLGLPNYTNNLRRLGWGDEDLSGGGSDRLVDALVAWGDVDAVAARVAEHRDAGADHVCLQVLDPDATAVPMDAWRDLAAALVPPPAPAVAPAAPAPATAPARKAARAKAAPAKARVQKAGAPRKIAKKQGGQAARKAPPRG